MTRVVLTSRVSSGQPSEGVKEDWTWVFSGSDEQGQIKKREILSNNRMYDI